MTGLRRLYSNSAVYALGSFLSKAIGFVMIPIYTRCLTPADYGTVELMYRATDVVSMLAAMGLGAAILRFYFEYKDEADRNEVVSTGLIAVLVGGGLLSFLFALSRDTCSMLLFSHGRYGTLVLLAAISMFIDLGIIVPLSLMQAEQKSVRYTGVSLIRLIAGLSLNVLFVVHLRWGVLGVAWSSVLSSGFAALVVLPDCLRRTGLRFSRSKMAQLLRYGLPLVPGQFAMFLLNFGDRFILQHYGGMTVVGLYSLGYKFGMLVSILLTQPFMTAWLPYALSIAEVDAERRSYSDTLSHFSLVCVGFGLALALFARDIVGLVATPAYMSAYTVVPPICLGYTLMALAYQLEIGIFISKRTAYRALTVISAAVLNIGLNLLLTPRFGAVGAAWATAASFGLMAIVSYVVSSRLFPISYDFRRIVGTLVLGVGVYASSTLVRPNSTAASLAINLAFLASFPLGLIASGIWPRHEIARMKSILLGMRSSPA